MKKTARGKNAAPPCPINAALLMLGDRWTLLIVRNLLFARATGFNEIQRAGEGMATNILTDRLAKLIEMGAVEKRPDEHDGRKWIYSLTEKGFDLAPILLELSRWGVKYQKGVAPDGVLEAYAADAKKFLASLRA
jgi:DNA-binding HxlR family transcriptional regulator